MLRYTYSDCLVHSAEDITAGREMDFDTNVNSVYFLYLANVIDKNDLTPDRICRGNQHDG